MDFIMSIKIILFFFTSLTIVAAINLRNSTKIQPSTLHGNPPRLTQTIQPIPLLPSSQQHQRKSTNLCNITVFRKLRLPWMDAFGACKALGNGTELVSIRSDEDYTMLSNILKETDSPLPVIFWTSGVDLVEEGVYSWMADGTPVENNATFWSAGQPDNLWDSEHCLGLRRRLFDMNYKLADENCHLAGAFLCAQRCL